MRQIGTLPDEESALRFSDYLVAQGMKTRVDSDSDGWEVWVYDDDHVEQAKEELARFRETPEAPEYREAAAEAERRRRQAEKEEQEHRKRQVKVRERWERPLSAQCPFTFGMIGISVVVALLSTDFSDPLDIGAKREPVLNYLLIVPVEEIGGNRIQFPYLSAILAQGQVWRLVTPIFIHFGVLHILFNMMWLRELGTAIELRRGKLRFALLVLAIAVLSNVGQYLTDGPLFGGMSGVVFGLFGYIWMKSRFEPEAGLYMPPNLVFLMIAFLVLCYTGAVGRIANTAHTVGLVVGMTAGALPSVWREMTKG